jgi:predicted nucleic acid-binding protein
MSPQSGLLLDACVVAELRGGDPHPAVVGFLRQRRHLRVYLSVLTFGELRRRAGRDPQLQAIGGWLDELKERFAENILPVDHQVAQLWGQLACGAGAGTMEALIAATALDKNLTVVSRKAESYRKLSVPAVNPWQAAGAAT